MDNFEGKHQTLILLEEILLKYAKDLYTQEEMGQLLGIFLNLYNCLIDRMGQLIAHHEKSLARTKEYGSTSTSEAVRYLIINEIISNPKTDLAREFSNAMKSDGPLLINDYAFGKGSAINALIRCLFNNPEVTLDVRVKLMDIKDPIELIKYSKKLSQRENVTTHRRDIREKPNEEFNCRLGIIGYVYFYLNIEDFFKSILYRLKESQFITILPAGPDYARHISAMIIGKVDGEYKSTLDSKEENSLLNDYYIFN